MHIVVYGVKTEIESCLISRFFIFLTAVLLIAYKSLQQSFAKEERVVPNSLVMMYLLERKSFGIGVSVANFTLAHTWCEVIIAHEKMTIAPAAV